MRRRRARETILGLSCGLMLAANALAAGIESDTGWWVILGAFADADLSSARDADITKLKADAARCGFEPFNDFSNKFHGFAPGYDVVTLGAFASKSKALDVRRAVERCVPGAYVKFGRHLGE
jgi:hypothetical protein